MTVMDRLRGLFGWHIEKAESEAGKEALDATIVRLDRAVTEARRNTKANLKSEQQVRAAMEEAAARLSRGRGR